MSDKNFDEEQYLKILKEYKAALEVYRRLCVLHQDLKKKYDKLLKTKMQRVK